KQCRGARRHVPHPAESRRLCRPPVSGQSRKSLVRSGGIRAACRRHWSDFRAGRMSCVRQARPDKELERATCLPSRLQTALGGNRETARPGLGRKPMAYTLQQLSDLEDIRTLKYRYYRGIDTADMELLTNLFTDDVVVDYRGGGYRVSLSGKENMLEFLANSFNSGSVAMHHGHMPEITLT